MRGETIPDSKQREAALVANAMSEYFAKGGTIQTLDKPLQGRDEPILPAKADKHRERSAAKQRALSVARIKEITPDALRLHKQGYALSFIAGTLGSSVATVKRALFEAGEDPGANSDKAISRQQVLALMETADGGGTCADAARWAGVSLAQARGAARDYGFKYGKSSEVTA